MPSMIKGHIIHIGLQKTGTTALQFNVYHRLDWNRHCYVDYYFDEHHFLDFAYKHHSFGLDDAELSFFKMKFNQAPRFVCDETLVSTDPAKWELAADRNLELFGRQAKILITVRSQLDYFASLISQRAMTWDCYLPESYFVSDELYSRLAELDGSIQTRYFNVDMYDLHRLHDIYTSRFEEVIFVEHSNIGCLDFLSNFLAVRPEKLEELRHNMAENKINVGLDGVGVNMRFKVQALLSKFGLKRVGPGDISAILVYQELTEKINDTILNVEREEKSISARSKRLSFDSLFYFAVKKVKKLLFIVCFSDTVNWLLGRKRAKYKLPSNIYLNDELLEKNSLFINEIIERVDE